jgi:eukaryotic-like serine/threonine-protein kinase
MSGTALTPGSRIGPYEVIGLLGSGGMGEVYRARDGRLSRDVALKVVHAELARDAERLRRFEQEARAAGSLNHPNIVAVYDTGEANGAPYIVTELLQGATLRERLSAGRLAAHKAAEIAVQVARGLAAAHDKGIVHRDLKPENLFLTKDGLAKILDFGIAKLGRPSEARAGTGVETESNTDAGTRIGTVGYMSPEQVRGLTADHRSDLFSFGVVLFEMLTGRRAFKGATAADKMSATLREDPTEPAQTGELPAGLLRVLRRCLEKSPDDRFQNARDLAFAVESASTETTGASSLRSPLPRRPRLARFLAWGAVMLAVAGAGLFAGRALAPPSAPASYQRLTGGVGQVRSAAIAPDQQTIVYSARSTGPSELFMIRPPAPGSTSLGVRDASVLAISVRQELALLVRPRDLSWGGATEGTLARMPLTGGSAREVLEGVTGADWSRDGKELAVTHGVGDRYRLEYPIGHVLYEPEAPRWLRCPRLAPHGDAIAFVEHPLARAIRGEIVVLERGQRRVLASGFASVQMLFWSPRGDELWFSAAVDGAPKQILAVSRSGRQRVVAEFLDFTPVLGLSSEGRALLELPYGGGDPIRARVRGHREEVALSGATLSDLADDGSVILGTDVGLGTGPNFSLFMQRTDGSPPTWLGEGDGQVLSPDGRFALALQVSSQPQQLLLVPTAAGETKTLERGEVVRYERAVFDPTGRQVVFAGVDKQDVVRIYVQDLAGGPPRSVSGEDVTLAKLGRPVSPDGRWVAAVGPDGVPARYPLAGGEPVPIPGVDALDLPLGWTANGRELLVSRYEDRLPTVRWIDLTSGRERPWRGLDLPIPAGLEGQIRLLVAPDGGSYAYSFVRSLSNLYISSPLR